MEEATKNKIRSKLCEHQELIQKLEDDKKAQNSAYGERIKSAKARIGSLLAALRSEDLTHLEGRFSDHEIEALA